ncbi:nitroreductase family protein [Tateyamaria sp.]|uniref:nitroreductase family protein n=1 Tax=Tateyamaria sp. TaxID=1929288 RepID=UPI00329BC235
MTRGTGPGLQSLLNARFGDAPRIADETPTSDLICSMAAHASCRKFLDKPVPQPVLEMLCATALASPTKSDLQQRDIIALQAPDVKQRLVDLVAGQAWVAGAPTILVFCGNNRRQRLLHDWKEIPFANDHLDAFFNAVGDAAIALGAFVTAADSIGLRCCPISAVRNEAEAVSKLLGLPNYVFPFAGLAVGYPAQTPEVSKRLPLKVTCHVDRYNEASLLDEVADYDADRALTQPYEKQRLTDSLGHSDTYSWSEDKARQYSEPERNDFGRFVRAQGFKLD